MNCRTLYLCLIMLLPSISSIAQKQYAIKMAETIMKTYPDSMVVMKYLTHLVQDNLVAPGQTPEEAQKSRPANWNYEIGTVLMGFERLGTMTGNPQYMAYTKRIIDHFITPEGDIRTFDMEEYNIDNIPTGRQLIALYQQHKAEKYKKAATLLRKQIYWQPRNKLGGFWHKLKYPSQMWLDGLYMAEPFYAQYIQTWGPAADYDDVINQFVWMEKKSRHAKTGLLYHGWDESRQQGWANKTTGLSPEFWSRSMGWYIMGLVDVLDFIPANHPRRPELLAILKRLSTALLAFQDKATGTWWQVTDKANHKGNYLESSGSSMFIYGLAKGVRMGYLPKTYMPAIKKGFDGIIKEFIETDEAGSLHLTKAVGGAGLGGTPYRDGSYEYYVTEPVRSDDLKSVGPFMQACLEVEMLFNAARK